MRTSRRAFLGTLAGAAVGATLFDMGSAWARQGHLYLFQRGDIVTFQGIYHVNPITGAPTGMLRDFVVTRDVSADEDGYEIEVHPALPGIKPKFVSGPLFEPTPKLVAPNWEAYLRAE